MAAGSAGRDSARAPRRTAEADARTAAVRREAEERVQAMRQEMHRAALQADAAHKHTARPPPGPRHSPAGLPAGRSPRPRPPRLLVCQSASPLGRRPSGRARRRRQQRARSARPCPTLTVTLAYRITPAPRPRGARAEGQAVQAAEPAARAGGRERAAAPAHGDRAGPRRARRPAAAHGRRRAGAAAPGGAPLATRGGRLHLAARHAGRRWAAGVAAHTTGCWLLTDCLVRCVHHMSVAHYAPARRVSG